MHPNLPDLKQGDLVAGRFRIVETIGSGGFSIVYRAHQEGMNRFVALKVLKPKASADAAIVERFRREALFASHLTHPNTINLFDYGQTDDGLCYIAMEYLDGFDLSAVVQRGEPMELDRVWRILTQTCRSLAEAHRLGLIHRDLKPENIFLVQRDDMEFVKVLDFGVSKAVSDFSQAGPQTLAPLTVEGTVFGTPLYMAPEQAMADPLTAAVDVYALGHIAYEMITGRAAYDDSGSAMDVMLRQINDPPLELPAAWKNTPFANLIRICTQKDPAMRPADAGQMLELLLDEAFAAYMDPAEKPPGLRTLQHEAVDIMTTTELPEVSVGAADEDDAEVLYERELEVLEEALGEVQECRQVRLVLLRARPGTGRSQLLRTFLARVAPRDRVLAVHRQSDPFYRTMDLGLEADLACVLGQPLRGQGIGEIHRLLRKAFGDDEALEGIEQLLATDSSPLSQLATARENFLTRISYLFRRATYGATLVWGLENLEQTDTFTLAFLERFFRELQSHPAPILIVATAHVDELHDRPGTLRYLQNLLQSPRPLVRQIKLATSELRRSSEVNASVWIEEFTNTPGFGGVGPKPPTPESPVMGLVIPAAHVHATLSGDASTVDDSGFEVSSPASQLVLGYLAQLGERVEEKLWAALCETLLPRTVRAQATWILEHAERFGIVSRDSRGLQFVSPEYAGEMRASFENLPDAREAHRRIGRFLRARWKEETQSNHEQVRLITQHATAGGDLRTVLKTLVRAGEMAYAEMNFDAAREYYLQVRTLMETDAAPGDTQPDGSRVFEHLDRPRIWLRLGEVHGAMGEYGAAEDALGRAVQEAPEDAFRIRGAAYKILADLALAQNRNADALESYEQACEIFRRAGLARAYVSALAEIGRCAVLLGRIRQAENLLGQALEKAHRIQDSTLVARIHRYHGQMLTRQARFARAVEHFGNAAGYFDQLGRTSDSVGCLMELGQAHLAAGRFDAAHSSFARVLELGAQQRVALTHEPYLGKASALAALGGYERAEGHLLEALAFFSERRESMRMAEIQFYLGDLYLATGRPGLAAEYFEHVFDLARSVGQVRLAFDSLVRQAYAAFDAGEELLPYDRLTAAGDFAEGVSYSDGKLVARAHIIYLQLVEHGFRTRGDTFSSLVADEDDSPGPLRQSHLLSSLFRVDVALAREDHTEAAWLLDRVRFKAAQAGDFALFIALARRQARLDRLRARARGTRPTPDRLPNGHSLGACIPPEVGRRA